MKKILSLVLAVLMLTALMGVPAFAEETMPVALNETGVTLNIPYSYLNTSGYVSVSDGSELAPGVDMYCTEVNYLAMPYDAVEELDPNSEEDMQRYFNSMASLFVIFSLGPGKTVGDLCSYLDSAFGQEGVIDTSRLTQIAEVDGYTFYLYQDPLYQDTSSFPDPEYEAEYEELLSRTDEILELSDFSRPRDHFENMTGSGLDFVTTDLDGNMISSKDLFAQHEVTLLNVWASWCGPCQDELPELEAINNRIAADDCAVVGLLYDGDEDEAVEAARQVLQASGVTYLVIRPPENVDEIFNIQCYPTTFYISRDGKFLGEPTEGADVDEYGYRLDQYLSGADSSQSVYRTRTAGMTAGYGTEKNVMPNDAGAYRVFVADEKGNPVQGAAVQFCSDSQCMMAKTDENGMAVFAVEPGSYSVHILKVPSDYEKHLTEYRLSDTYSDVVVVLNFK